MLTGIAYCMKCQGRMYQISSGRWKDGKRKEYHYYRCHGTEKQASTCRNMYPVAKAEAAIDHGSLTTGGPGRPGAGLSSAGRLTRGRARRRPVGSG